MPDSPSRAPIPKVVAAGVAGAAATVIVIIIQTITGAQAPVGLEGALATLCAFGAGYLTSPAGVNYE